ncbi:TPA: helix-turn-helix transcriptional regulator [Candidatus Avigastranaerophilus faecigallinarum]|nr:helix-turn-helix transcriptional regulator [Candidatus Avigastranaerophilus faecigallinarum]
MGIKKIRNKIGRNIKSLRIEKGLSQEKLAEYVNISREHLSCLERGKYSINIETLYNIAKFFEVDIKYFF